MIDDHYRRAEGFPLDAAEDTEDKGGRLEGVVGAAVTGLAALIIIGVLVAAALGVVAGVVWLLALIADMWQAIGRPA